MSCSYCTVAIFIRHLCTVPCAPPMHCQCLAYRMPSSAQVNVSFATEFKKTAPAPKPTLILMKGEPTKWVDL